MHNYLIACGLAAGSLALFASTQARATTMDQAEANGFTIVEGDKTFSDFTYASATLDATQVTVAPVTSGFGLVFTAGWNTAANATMDSVIGYEVTINSGNQVIKSGSLDMAGLVSVGGGTASVGETLKDFASPANTYSMSTFYDGGSDVNNKLSDTVAIKDATKLSVIKDITVSRAASGGSSYAAVSFVDNTFTQGNGGGGPPPVPEPMSLALIPLALAGLGLRRKLAH